MSSTRLPNKVVLPGIGKTMIEHQVERLKISKFSKNLVLATTKNKEDYIFQELFNKKKLLIFNGSTKNVLKRFYDCAKYFKADIVVRFTGDCPLIDYRIVDEVISYFIKNDFDYVNNIDTRFIPDGLHIEIFNFESLEIAYAKARASFDKEHVTPFILKNKKLFKIKKFITKKYTIKNLRLTLDYIDDYFLIKKIFQELYKKNKKFSIREVINLIKKKPYYLKLNKKFYNLQNIKFKKIR
jgi:spore coat polysaccharide biosynthesis protein SpsF